MSDQCLFCQIANGSIPSFKIWEDEHHLAFLDIFPNCLGQTVVISKKHFSSYFADLPSPALSSLIVATKKVGKILDAAFADVSRTALVFEGFGVNHIHAKLYPLHGTGDLQEFQAIEKNRQKDVPKQFFDRYQGYIASYSYDRMADQKLKSIADMIINSQK